jgi:hypothetical protein
MGSDGCVILFVKAPEMGQVKTRLASSLGGERVLDLYRCFVEDTLAMLVRGGFRLFIFFAPPASRSHIAAWLGERYALIPQNGEDLGERMRNAFQKTFAMGFDAALILGSDSPDLPDRIIDEALAALEDHDAVLGPARDGGYYLIGFRKESFLPRTFQGIPWSTRDVFARTMAILKEAGLGVYILPLWQDVDSVEDLRSLAMRNIGTAFGKSSTMTWIGKAHEVGEDLATTVKR